MAINLIWSAFIKWQGVYDNIDNPDDVDVITFVLDKVPLQDFVSAMRKSAVHAVNDAKVTAQIDVT